MFYYLPSWVWTMIRIPQVFSLEYACIDPEHLNRRNYNPVRYTKVICMKA
jgi:hypothetical protein